MYIKNFIPPHEITKADPKKPILIALSGGADSTLLAKMLSEYSARYGTPLYAAHINHMIRGDEADRDENFCRELCEKLSIGFFSLKIDVPAASRRSGRSLETEARAIRYGFFDKIMREKDIHYLATAHNADDNLETLIFNLVRGSGVAGMGGIAPIRELSPESGSNDDRKSNEKMYVIRPIIKCTKKDILAYCAENDLPYVTDSTNADDEYSRNRIRLHVVPELAKINPSAAAAALRLSEAAREACDLVNSQADSFLCGYATAEDGNYPPVPAHNIGALHPAVAKKVLATLISRARAVVAAKISKADDFAGSDGVIREYSPEGYHLNAVYELCRRGAVESYCSLPGGIRARISSEAEARGCLVFECEPERAKHDGGNSDAGNKGNANALKDERIYLEMGVNFFGSFRIVLSDCEPDCEKVFSDGAVCNNSKPNFYNQYTYSVLKFDRIIGRLYARVRRPGDVILRGGMSKKVKDIMNEAKVPASLRDEIPLICLDRGGDNSNNCENCENYSRENYDRAEEILAIPGIPGAVREGFSRRSASGAPYLYISVI